MRPKVLDHAIRRYLMLEYDKYYALQDLIKTGRLPYKTLSAWVRHQIDDELSKWR